MTSISVSFGGINSGNQVGINYGSIHLPQERPQTPPPPLSTVPFRRDPDFVDRGSLLDQIYEKGTTPGAWIALVGLGGVGKSQLAIECCYRIREKSPETWVLWIHAGNAARFEQSCRDIADRVKITGRTDPTANIFKLIHDWLVEERDRKWVLILDNVDDSSFLHEVPPVGQGKQQSGQSGAPPGRPLLTYLPINHNGTMIVTSRSRSAAVTIVEESDIIQIEPMDLSHATMLFEKKLGAQIEKGNIIQLATELDYMPLAIVQAASYIKQRTPRVSVPQYLEDFQKSDRKRTSLLAYDGGQLRRDWEAKNSILITWQISFNHIKQTQPAATDLLSLMSFFDRQGIPGTLLQHRLAKGHDDTNINSEAEIDIYDDDKRSKTNSGVDDDFEENIMMLRNYSMISTSVDGATFEMHRLVQLAMRKWLEVHRQLEHWKQKFIEILFCAFPTGDFDTWTVCQPLFSHVQSAVAQRPDEEGTLKKWASLLYTSAWFAYTKGDIIECEKMAVLAMKTREKLFGPHNEQTVNSIGMTGLAYILGGRWKDAESLQLQLMETHKRMLGPEHISTLTSMHNLALTYLHQGRWKEAEELYLQVIEARKQALGLEHPYTLTSMSNLASTYRNQGRWKEAEELYLQVIEAHKQVLGLEHPDTLTSMANLASTYQYQGRWKEAEELYLQVIEAHKQVLGPAHPHTLASMGNLASIYQNQGRWRDAEKFEVHVIETRKEVLGPEHPETLVSIVNLASTYQNQGRWKKAEELQAEGLKLCSQVLGPGHPYTLTNMANLALTYQYQGRWKEAEELYLQAIETRKQVLGLEHPDTLTGMGNLASTYWDQGRWKEAENLQLQVTDTLKQVLGPEHPNTLTSMANLALTILDQGRWKEAEELNVHLMETRKQVLGPEHPDTLTSMHNLAHTLRSLGQFGSALSLMTECARLRGQILGPDHPDTMSSTSALNGWDDMGNAPFTLIDGPTGIQMAVQNRAISAEPPERNSKNGRPRRRTVLSRLLFCRK
ncbi:unnamed protein product [Penicillium egyptiacum]|uniref:DUF7779 domain-containing protein n=1 Tax=Penicillium egyptiacum TaxID=1303716 RepID=A0A9W4KA67_9EURO|nr:unnamed protein product [Penicillium egyptiacum]